MIALRLAPIDGIRRGAEPGIYLTTHPGMRIGRWQVMQVGPRLWTDSEIASQLASDLGLKRLEVVESEPMGRDEDDPQEYWSCVLSADPAEMRALGIRVGDHA